MRTAKSCRSGAPKQALRPLRCSRVLRVTVATKRWSPRRARISRKTIAQGRPDDPGYTCGSAACFFVARGPWVRWAPGLPCALCFSRVVRTTTRALFAPREREVASVPLFDNRIGRQRRCQRQSIASASSLMRLGRAGSAMEVHSLSRSSRGRVGVGVLPQNALVERIDLPPPAGLFRARRPPPQAGEVDRVHRHADSTNSHHAPAFCLSVISAQTRSAFVS